MFYPNNINYMEDLYYYNQQPNTYMGQPGMIPNMNNQYMPNQYFPNGINNSQNLTSYYPSIYRIMNPVIQRVVSNNSNMMTPNEDQINNMVDTVYNIIEGQLPRENSTLRDQNNNQNNTQNQNANTSSTNQTNQNSSLNTIQNERQTNTLNDSLFRDIIKILIIKELISRIQNQRPQCPIQNFNPGMGNMVF